MVSLFWTTGRQWLLCTGDRRWLLADAVTIPVTAGCNSTSGRCALQPHLCTCCSWSELRPLPKSMEDARWSKKTCYKELVNAGVDDRHPTMASLSDLQPVRVQLTITSSSFYKTLSCLSSLFCFKTQLSASARLGVLFPSCPRSLWPALCS